MLISVAGEEIQCSFTITHLMLWDEGEQGECVTPDTGGGGIPKFF